MYTHDYAGVSGLAGTPDPAEYARRVAEIAQLPISTRCKESAALMLQRKYVAGEDLPPDHEVWLASIYNQPPPEDFYSGEGCAVGGSGTPPIIQPPSSGTPPQNGVSTVKVLNTPILELGLWTIAGFIVARMVK